MTLKKMVEALTPEAHPLRDKAEKYIDEKSAESRHKKAADKLNAELKAELGANERVPVPGKGAVVKQEKEVVNLENPVFLQVMKAEGVLEDIMEKKASATKLWALLEALEKSGKTGNEESARKHKAISDALKYTPQYALTIEKE